MVPDRHSRWRRLKQHIRSRLLSGLLFVVPLGVTFLVLEFLFRTAAGLLSPLIKLLFGRLPDYAVALLSLGVVLLLVWLIGSIADYVVGRRLIAFGESLLARIPLVRTIHSASKQAVDALSLPDRASFKAPVLIDFPHPGLKSFGFVAGTLRSHDGQEFYKVYVPTTPQPLTGYLEIVPRDKIHQTNLSVEDAFKMIVSGGILAPERLEMRRNVGDEGA